MYMIGNFFNFDKKDDDEEKSKEETNNDTEKVSQKSEYVDEDPVEKIFNFFFGEKEENPMGLSRFGSEERISTYRLHREPLL